MSAINSETRDAWKAIADKLSKQRPAPGRRVLITGGRKHKGKSGTVLRHQQSRFENVFRYASEAQAHMRQMRGREGYVVLVCEDSGEQFWVKAEYTKVL